MYYARRVATFVIGDVQGCFAPLCRLLERCGFVNGRDALFFVGDLVNRGPQSLEVLRLARDLGAGAVLGNHDLHLLGRVAGVVGPKRRDTLDDVLSAPDRDGLIDWLRARPFLQDVGQATLVHAGILPGLRLELAHEASTRLSTLLRGEGWLKLPTLLRTVDATWATVADEDRDALAVGGFVSLRACRPDGRPLPDFHGTLSELPPGARPWFDFPAPDRNERLIVCGHWAALGLHQTSTMLALDTGCVWGRQLTAVRLDDFAFFHEPADEGQPT